MVKRSVVSCAWMLASLLMALALPSQARADGEVTVSAQAQRVTAHPGDQFAVAVVFEFEEGWHIWPHVPELPPELKGLEPIPTEITLPEGVVLPKGVRLATDFVQWPEAHLVEVKYSATPLSIKSYAGKAVAFVPVLLDAGVAPGDITLKLAVTYQTCNESTCLRKRTEILEVPIRVVATAEAIKDGDATVFTAFQPSVFAKVLAGPSGGQGTGGPTKPSSTQFDFLGYTFKLDSGAYVFIFAIAVLAGMLMNFTPCVLPVIPLKVLSLQNQAKQGHSLALFGTAYCLGIVAVFVAIAVVALVLGISFGQWFSYWFVTIPLALFIAFMGIGMMGIYAIRLPNWIYSIDGSHETVRGNFIMGLLTGVLSTPCTGPMVGAAFAWATREPPAIGFTAIVLMGVGMALPYGVLIAFPKLIDKMPRGGAGGELLKQVLGWFMLAVAAYIGTNVIPGRWPFWIVGALAAVGCVWWAVGAFKMLKSPLAKVMNPVLAALTLVVVGLVTVSLTGVLDEKSPWRALVNVPDADVRKEIDTAVNQGRTVVVDFTAKWCTNCLVIEKTILSTQDAKAIYSKYNPELIKVDLTNAGDTQGWGVVKEVLGGGGSIPLIAIYGPGTGTQKPVYFASFFSISALEDALKQASGPKVATP